MTVSTHQKIDRTTQLDTTVAAQSASSDFAAMAILGLGTATPEHFFSQEVAAEMAKVFCGTEDERRSRLLKKLYSRAGVEKRYSVLLNSSSSAGELADQDFYTQAASDDDGGPTTAERMAAYELHAANLACRAATSALHDSRVSPSEVTHLVTVSCSGFTAPGTDVKIIKQLGLSADTQRTSVGFMGCHGAINGMRVARGITAADENAVVLLCAVELCTIHQQYGWDPAQTTANALFADGAAALVGMQASSVPMASIGHQQGQGGPWKVVGGGSAIIPDTEHMMSWRIGDHGFRMTLAREVPVVIEERLGDWLHPWLATFGLTVADVGCWAAHPGGPKILAGTAAGAGITMQDLNASTQVLAHYGNMSSPTVLFVLEKLRQQAASLPCVVLGFGPGLAIEAVLIG